MRKIIIIGVLFILILASIILFNFSNNTSKTFKINKNEYLVNNSFPIIVPVLSYHQIESPSYINTIVSPTNFAEQMAELNSSGFSTITYDQWYNWTKGLGTIPEKSIIIVFDDGRSSVLNNAVPIMKTYGFIGILGVITNDVPKGTKNNYMNWKDIRTLRNKGWQIASHSVSHLNITSLDYIQRQLEFNNSKNAIEGNISIIPTLFIYPDNINDYTTDDECALYYNMCSGYSAGIKTPDNYLFKNSNYTHEIPLGLRRIIIANDTSLSQFKNILIATNNYNNLKLNNT